MDLGTPNLKRIDLLVDSPQPVYIKPLWERSAFVTWATGLAGILTGVLTGTMSWDAAGKAALAATVAAAIALFVTKDSLGTPKPPAP